MALMPAVATAMLTGASSALAVQHIRIMRWIAPFIGAMSLAQPVERCTPALVVCLCSAMLGIVQIMAAGKHEDFKRQSSV